MKHICIAQQDDGTIMVGEMPAEMMEGMDEDYLQPADNLDAALSQARSMLQGEGMDTEHEEDMFRRGLEKVRGKL